MSRGNADGTSMGKVPINPKTGRNALVNNPDTAGTFNEALAAIPDSGGIGVLVTNATPGVVALDFDHVIDGGVFNELGAAVVEAFTGAYVEISPSGTGLRVFALGTVNTSRQRGGGVEIYPAGITRWLRMTGAVVTGAAGVVADCQAGIDWAVGLLTDSASKDGGQDAGPVQAVAKRPGQTGRAGALAAIESTFAQLGELRPAVEPDEVMGRMLADTQAPTTNSARTLSQALKVNEKKWDGDRSKLDSYLFCEVVRRGCDSVDSVRDVVEATKAKRDKWGELRGDLSYLELTAGHAAAAVLKEMQGKAAKGKRAAVDPTAVAEIEAAGAVFTRTQSGHVQAGFANIVEVLRLDSRARGLFAYDLYKGRMYRTASLVALDSKAETEIGPVTDDDYRRVALFLHREYGMKAKLEDVRDAVKTVAKDEKFDPVRASLEKLGTGWDRKERLSGWLVRYMKIDESVGAEYVHSVGRACIIQAVRRVFEPGARAETMPVFVGPGGEGKGKAFQALANAVGPGLFTNGGFDISKTSDIVEKCRGRLIVEASELDCVKRTRDVSSFKAAMSVAEDTHRKAYESEPEDFKRAFTIWGSSNEDEFITDASNGQGRRVWPLFTLATPAAPIDVLGIEQVGGQLWGEAVAAYLSGELSYFDAVTSPVADLQWTAVIERCRIPDPMDDALNDYLMQWAMDPQTWRSSTAIASAMQLPGAVSGRVEKKDFHALAESLKARKMKKKTMGRTRGWEFTPAALAEYRALALDADMTASSPPKVVKLAKK